MHGEKPVGYGKKTTGGGDSVPVIVRSFAEASAALSRYREAFKAKTQISLVLHYTGRFDYKGIKDVCAQQAKPAQTLQVTEVENVTIEGAPDSRANFGIDITAAKNIIIRNMTIGLVAGGPNGDTLTIGNDEAERPVENVWVDHNELFSSAKDCGVDAFDGLLDIMNKASWITVSYNYFHDHKAAVVVGISNTDLATRHVTFHHNWFDKLDSRTPQQTSGYVHSFNNYYSNIWTSGINVRKGGQALIESNVFENSTNPITSRSTDEVGYWELDDNLVGSGVTWSTPALANADHWRSTQAFARDELGYSYTPDDTRCVKEIVQASAGATLKLPSGKK
jgi:pectate lyase